MKFTNRSYDMCAVGSQDKTFAKSNTPGAAGAAASVTVAHDSTTVIYVTGILVTSTAPAATVAGAVTLSGLTTQDGGGAITAEFVESAQFGGNLQINFANPIPAQDNGTDVVLSVPAIASGGVVAATVLGYRRPE